jgi:hypothetical protein
MIDRVATATALAKCIAFQLAGKPDLARLWFLALANLLGYKLADHNIP